MSESTYCDFVTVSQNHDTPHPPFHDGMTITYGPDGTELYPTLKHRSVPGKHGTNMQIRSDGRKIQVSGNISKYNQPDNVHGISLDNCKSKLNELLATLNLPPFTNAETVRLQTRNKATVVRGATFSRIDMMQNFAAGNAPNREKYLQWIQQQNHPTLKLKKLVERNTYYGRGEGRRSSTREILIYDKALELLQKESKLPGRNPYHLKAVASQLSAIGAFRIEQRFYQLLRNKDLHLWQNATHTNLCDQFQKDVNLMNKPISVDDLDDIPAKLLGTLCMYLQGLNPQQKLHRNTFSVHKRELKELGYDISNYQNVHRIKPKPMTIEIREIPPTETFGLPDPLEMKYGE